MFNRVMLVAVLGMLILCLAGCAGEEKKTESAPQPAAEPAPAPKPEEKVPIYELTKEDLTTHEGWTSRNVSILGVKLGDRTRDVEKNLGNVENTRTLPLHVQTYRQSAQNRSEPGFRQEARRRQIAKTIEYGRSQVHAGDFRHGRRRRDPERRGQRDRVFLRQPRFPFREIQSRWQNSECHSIHRTQKSHVGYYGGGR